MTDYYSYLLLTMSM